MQNFNAVIDNNGYNYGDNNNNGHDNFMDSEFNSILMAMPNFKRGGNDEIQKVANHNNRFLGKFKNPENRNALTMVGQEFCWTCKRPDHRSYSCPDNVGKEPPFPMPHKPKLLQEFEKNAKPFSSYKHKNGRFHEMNGEPDGYNDFIWIGEQGLDGKTESDVSPSQLFLIC